MRIDPKHFQQTFTQRVATVIKDSVTTNEPSSASSAQPEDQVTLSRSPDKLSFQAAVSAMATSASLGGIPALAALCQDVAQSLISKEQELSSGRNMVEQFSSLPRVDDQRVESTWKQIAKVTESRNSAPVVLESSFIDAQADSSTILIGTGSLKADLADDNVLAFTIAHEEGHRQHRDTAGAAGLELLVKLCEHDEELFGIAFKALSEGRQQNEREADLFATNALKNLDYQREPILQFLSAMPGDMQHPPGTERARLVEESFQQES